MGLPSLRAWVRGTLTPVTPPERHLVLETRPCWRRWLGEVIFGRGSRAAQTYDQVVIASVAAVMVESLPNISLELRHTLRLAEWVFTFIFTLDYAARLLGAEKPWIYAGSYWSAPLKLDKSK